MVRSTTVVALHEIQTERASAGSNTIQLCHGKKLMEHAGSDTRPAPSPTIYAQIMVKILFLVEE